MSDASRKIKSKSNGRMSPAAWIPTLYLAEGLPYAAVNILTVVMYVNLGISLKEMAYYTGWLYLPWVIKPFWSPFIDLLKTKRYWIILMQLLLTVSMASVGFFITTSFFFGVTLVCFWIMAFCSATHDIAADGYYMLELDSHQQAAYVGVRSTFYRIANLIGQGGLVILAGILEKRCNEISTAWSIIFGTLSVFFLLVTIYHSRVLPRPDSDKPVPGVTARNIALDFLMTFVTFVKKPGFIGALVFMLFYRLPEAFCVKLIQPFMLASHDQGGLAMSTEEVGFVNGTIGVIALLAGGIIGGLAIALRGLKKMLWPMALSLTLPCIVYCGLAIWQPNNMALIGAAIGVEQFGYGFGFTAYMLYLIYFSRGESKTSHYAFCTAFMALGMMLPGMAAGWIHEKLALWHWLDNSLSQGFINYFWFVMATCLFTFVACSVVKISPEFGIKTPSKKI